MSNGSLKEQLQAVASQFPESKSGKTKKLNKKAKPRPSHKAEKPKPRWLEYAQYGVELLRVYFPDCFKSVSDVKPLKKGIKEDLLKRLSTMEAIVTEDKACMVKSLSYYVNTKSYLKCVVEDAERIDLDGKPVGKITAEEAKYSLEKQEAKLKAKNQASADVAAKDNKESTKLNEEATETA